MLVVCMLLPIIAFSQIRYGVKASFNYTNVTKVHWDSEERKAFGVGVFAQIPLNSNNQFFFQPELVYSLQGETDGGEREGTGKVDYFQNYLNIPLMVRAYFSEEENEFFAELGPQLGFLVHQKNKELDETHYGKPATFDLSAGVGVGFSYQRKYEFFARYNYGLVDSYKGYNATGANRTSLATLTLAYVFN
jgi:hypothetical protein